MSKYVRPLIFEWLLSNPCIGSQKWSLRIVVTLSAVCHCDKYTPDLLFFEADGTDKLLFHNVALTRLGALAVKSSPMMVLLSEPQPWLLQSGLVAGRCHD